MPTTTKEPRQLTSRISHADERRRQRVAEPRERVRNALREPALLRRHPVRHRARRDRQRRHADAEQHAAEDHAADRLLASPISTVADDQMIAKTVNARRAPNLSATHPPAIWKARYG